MNKNKQMYAILIIFCLLSLLVFLASCFVYEKYKNLIFMLISMFLVIFSIILVMIFYVKVAKFECPNCKSVFKPKSLTIIMAVHTMSKRRLKCPYCNKTNWCKDIIK